MKSCALPAESKTPAYSVRSAAFVEMLPETMVSAPVLTNSPALLPGLSLRRNFSWTLAGNVIYSACQWGILIVIAKLGTPAMVGRFALALAVTAPLMILANQGLRPLQATDAKRSFDLWDYLGYRLLTTGVALLILGSISKVFTDPAVVLIVGVAKGVESISDVLYGYYQARDRMDCTATSMIMRGALSVLVVGALIYATGSIAWGASGLVISTMLVLVGYDHRKTKMLLNCEDSTKPGFAKLFRPLAPTFKSRTMYRLAILAFPLGLAQTLLSVTGNVPRYFTERYGGAGTLGIFAAIMYLMMIGNTAVTALAQSCAARLSKLYAKENRAAFRTLLSRLMLIAIGMGGAGILLSIVCGASILRIVYRPEYAEHASILVLAMVAAAFGYVSAFAGTALTAVRSIKILPIINAACVAMACLFSMLLIPRFGILGAAWAVLLTEGFQMVAGIWALEHAQRDNAAPMIGSTSVPLSI